MTISGIASRRALYNFQRGPQSVNVCLQCRRRLATDTKVFAEGDIVLLRQKDDPSHTGILTKPLRPSARIETHRGTLPHASIIGRRVRDIVSSSKNVAYRIHEPTLAEYVRLTPRLVTPIYPGDANLIVSLLDIHVSPPCPTDGATFPLEILEAGTGHGALTLHLARAIHAANAPPPRSAATQPSSSSAASDTETTSSSTIEEAEEAEDVSYDAPLAEPATTAADPYEAWRKSRRAVIHTIEISAKHSEQAQRTVSRFRRGMYAHSVDFHVGDVSDWITSQLSSHGTTGRGMEFLSHVFLDLPAAEEKLELVAKAMRVDGMLAVFNPSITQIGECVTRIKELKLPFHLEQVVELGPPRLWDLRVVRPRSVDRLENARGEKRLSIKSGEEGVESAGEEGAEGSAEGMSDGDVTARDLEQAEELEKKQGAWKMVCRPKVGERVVGGGFLGVWRRMRDMSTDGS